MPSDEDVLLFTSDRDVLAQLPADVLLLPHSIRGSIAHVLMLANKHIISPKDAASLVAALNTLRADVAGGKFSFRSDCEDVQTNVEVAIIDALGIELGGKIHTARSRNDQVALDMRLYLRAEAVDMFAAWYELLEAFILMIFRYKGTIMPGFTHYQPAMVTTFGHLLANTAVALVRDMESLIHWFDQWNRNPLGGAASYGTSFPIDRQDTSDLLGFSMPEQHSAEPITHRGEDALALVQVLERFLAHAANLAQTLIVFATPQYGYVTLSDRFSTGSSIMPQKKNPDPLEVIKGRAAYVQGQLAALTTLTTSMFIGYNKETQYSKYLVMDSIERTKPTASIFAQLLVSLDVHADVMEAAAHTSFLTATDVVEGIVRTQNLSFRQAKKLVERALALQDKTESSAVLAHASIVQAAAEQGLDLSLSEEVLAELQDPHVVLQQRNTVGAPGPKAISLLIDHLEASRERFQEWLANWRIFEEKAEELMEQRIAAL